MIVVVQRVARASVSIEGLIRSQIKSGLLVLVGVEEADAAEDIEWLSSKLVNLRVFNDKDGVMNVSVRDAGGEVLIVSQFTLHASTKKGNRPSYIKAARPETAVPIYEKFIASVSAQLGQPVQAGVFGADMQIDLVNDGPVTIIIDTKNKV